MLLHDINTIDPISLLILVQHEKIFSTHVYDMTMNMSRDVRIKSQY